MNVTSVLHRKGGVATGTPLAPAPDSTGLGPSRSGGPTPWPAGAKALVVVLVVAVVVSLAAALVGLRSGDDDSLEVQLRDRIETLTAERDDALDDVAALDAELSTLRLELGEVRSDASEQTSALEERIVELQTEIARVADERTAAVAAVSALTTERDDALATVAALTAERDEAIAGGDALAADLVRVRRELAAVTAQRDALADLSLDDLELVGSYDVKVSDVFGTAPRLTKATIGRTSQGYLTLSIPGFVEGSLFSADGALHLVANSTSVFSACDGVARTADVVATIFPAAVDGATGGVALQAVITAEAPATAGCAEALLFFSATLA